MAWKHYWRYAMGFLLLASPYFTYATHAGSSHGDGISIPNPLDPKYSDLVSFFDAIVDFLLLLAIPIAIFFLIYAGFLFVTAQGNEEQIKTAKKTLIWALVGVAVLLGAKVIATAIQGTVDIIRGK